MKVLFVSSGNSHYGIVPFINSQGESLKKEGVQIEYYTIKGKGIKGYLKSRKPFKDYLSRNKFDIIHAHYGLIGLFVVLCKTNIPMVLSVMGSDAYGSFKPNGRRKPSSYFEMFLTQIALMFAKKIIVKSQNILKLVPYKKKSFVIPNGVNFERFKPSSPKLEKNRILFMADPNNVRKNIKLLEEALNIINSNDIKLIVPFPVKPEDVPHEINNASVLVLTSYNEGSPNIIKESMACNIPIVSTDVGDVKEVISNTKGCYLSDFAPSDLANKIQEALNFGKRTNGRETIAHMEDSIVAKKIISIYQSII
jgi:teichuronic acid biosynthesis glycosyltransferase TuaC